MIPLAAIAGIVVVILLIALRLHSYQRSVNRLYGPKHVQRVQRMNRFVRVQSRIKEWNAMQKRAR